MRKKILDLFCGAGGAGVGLNRAGFDVVGVDIAPQPSYPFEFVQDDAIEYLLENWTEFDAYWASPPCQQFSWSTPKTIRDSYPNYIPEVREIFEEYGKPYVIENVPGAPLLVPLTLCGTMFRYSELAAGLLESRCDLKVFRHRIFESNITLDALGECSHGSHEAKKRRADNGDFFTVAGHWVGTLAEWSDAMGIDWMRNKHELAESIPPAYSEWIAQCLIKNL